MAEKARPRILLVDDDAFCLDVLARLCRSAGADAVAVSTAEEARAQIASSEFDLILLDLQLPRDEGLALIAEVEQDERLARKTAVVTGFTTIAPFFTRLPVLEKAQVDAIRAYIRGALKLPGD